MGSVLPAWLQWVQVVALVALPIVGAWIAAQQVLIARAKLRLDLFDRRFKVLDASRALIGSVLREGDTDPREVQKFTLATIDAEFLLDSGVAAYLEEIRTRAIKLRALKGTLEGVEDQQQRRRIVDAMSQEMTWLSGQGPALAAKFKPFMSLKEPSWFWPRC